MKKQDPGIELKAAIVQLEREQAEERILLKEQLRLAYESIKPINLIKSTFKEVAATPGLKDHVINTAVGLSVGYLSKMLFVGLSKNPVKKMLGNAVMIAVTNAVIKNPEAFKTIGINLYRLIRDKIAERTAVERYR